MTDIPPDSAARGKKLRILVVDDDVDGADMLAEVLVTKGHEVAIAHDATSALVLAHELLPQVACLDIAMPLISGYELALQIRALPGLENIHLIAITGYDREVDRQRSRECGFALHIVKPIDIDVVERAIRNLIAGPSFTTVSKL